MHMAYHEGQKCKLAQPRVELNRNQINPGSNLFSIFYPHGNQPDPPRCKFKLARPRVELILNQTLGRAYSTIMTLMVRHRCIRCILLFRHKTAERNLSSASSDDGHPNKKNYFMQQIYPPLTFSLSSHHWDQESEWGRCCITMWRSRFLHRMYDIPFCRSIQCRKISLLLEVCETEPCFITSCDHDNYKIRCFGP